MPRIRVQVAGSTTKLIQDPPDNLLGDAVVSAVLQDTPIATGILQAITNGYAADVESYYQMGISSVWHNLPTATNFSLSDNEDEVKVVLDTLYGKAVTLDSVSISKVDPSFLAIEALRNDPLYDMNAFTGLVTRVSDGQEFAIRSTTFPTTTMYIGLREVPNGIWASQLVAYPQTFTAHDVIYHVKFHFTDDEFASPIWWTYDPDLGTYPTLNLGTGAALGYEFYPVVNIRKNKINEVDGLSRYANRLKETGAMLKKVGVDLSVMTEALVDEDNPNAIHDIDGAFIFMGIDINTESDLALRYLYSHFRVLAYSSPYSQQDFITWEAGSRSSAPNTNRVYIAVGGKSFAIAWNYITVDTLTGNVDTYTTVPDKTVIVNMDIEIDSTDHGEAKVTKQIVDGVDSSTYDFTQKTIIFRKQVTSTTFIQIVVHGLRHKAVLFAGEYIQTDLTDVTAGQFFVPVSRDVIRLYPGNKQSEVFYQALQLYVYSHVLLAPLAWYQKPNFIKFVGIVITVIGLATGLGNLGQLISKGFSIEILKKLAIDILVDVLIQKAFLAIAKELWGDAALYLAAAYGIYTLSTDSKSLSELFDLLDAETLLKATTSLLNSVSIATRDKFLELEEETEALYKSVKEKQEELDAANDLLDTGHNLELYDIISVPTYTNFDESPASYYNRTIHIGNPGVQTLDTITNFVDRALTLPNTTDMINTFS